MFDQGEWESVKPDVSDFIVEVCGRWADFVLIADLLDDVRSVADAFYHPSQGALLDFCRRTAIRLIKRDYGAWILEGDTAVPDSEATTIRKELEEEGDDVALPYWIPTSEEGLRRWREILDVLIEQEREYIDQGLKPPTMADRRTIMFDRLGYTRGDDTIYRILKARRKGWI